MNTLLIVLSGHCRIRRWYAFPKCNGTSCDIQEGSF
uniref:Uncharacterized protein n=1 Tax=Arundo donax TaxID=35708 RepID=A0A0A9GYP5_ARUDO